MPGADADEGRFAGRHARRALAVIRQNVTLALLTKLAFLVSAALGAAPLWLAVVADTGATLAVTLNGLRLLRA
jgi:Cd2+/Zn2+-exporting ATPase